MAVVKLSSSGKQVQFITDDGLVFGTSVTFLQGLMSGKSPQGFLLLTRLPFKVSKDRFKPSPVWNPESGEKESDIVIKEESPELGRDSISKKVVVDNRERKAFSDKKVW